MRFWAVLILMLYSGTAFAECYDWPLRRGDGNRFVYDASTIYVSLPGLPEKLADFRVQVRGVVTPRIKYGECLDEKKRGKRARNYTVKLVSTAKNIQFCEPKWIGDERLLSARVVIDKFDLAKIFVEKGYGRTDDGSSKSWCIR
jgi:micrococcal nuclease